jgi:hypothetical protein
MGTATGRAFKDRKLTIVYSLRGDCSSFEVLIQCNRIESRVTTGEALPLPLQLGPAILWFKILSN